MDMSFTGYVSDLYCSQQFYRFLAFHLYAKSYSLTTLATEIYEELNDQIKRDMFSPPLLSIRMGLVV